MASPAYRSKTEQNAGSSGAATSLTVTKPTGTVDNDLLLMFVFTYSVAAVTPSGWTSLLTRACPSPYSGYQYAIFWKRAASEGASWSVGMGGTGGYIAAAATAYSGVNTTTAVDATGTSVTTGAATSAIAPSVTTTVADTLVIAGLFAQTGVTMTPPTGMTERSEYYFADLDLKIYVSDVAQAAAGASGTKEVTWGGASDNADWWRYTIALQPVAAAAATFVPQIAII